MNVICILAGLASLCFVFLPNPVLSQTPNDDIHNRSQLLLDSSVLRSNTAQSTVQWSCINRMLTKKCLVYHNDQWFHFNVKRDGRYFLNINGQQCKDKRGLQVILIEGNPCEVASYRIKMCIDQIPQDDVYIPMDSLKAGTDYLVNIDGFLNDFCEFDIALVSQPSGFPHSLVNHDSITVDVVSVPDSVINFKITIDALAAVKLKRIELHRSSSADMRYTLIQSVAAEKNAYGAVIREYDLSDTLTAPGTYHYRVLAIRSDEEPLFYSSPPVNISPVRSSVTSIVREEEYTVVHIPVDKKKKVKLDVYVYDALKLQLLRYDHIEVDGRRERQLVVPMQRYLDKGLGSFIIRVVDTRTRSVSSFKYVLNSQGELIMME